MSSQILVQAHNPDGHITQADLAALAASILEVGKPLTWAREPLRLPDEAHEDMLAMSMSLGRATSEERWHDLCQVAALTAVMSRERPRWLFLVSDDLGLAPRIASGTLWWQDGRVVRVAGDALGGAVEASPGRDSSARRSMQEVFELTPFGLDPDDPTKILFPEEDLHAAPEPDPEPVQTWSWRAEGPRSGGVKRSPHATRLDVRVLPPDRDGDAWFEVDLDVVNGIDGIADRFTAVVLLTDADGAPVARVRAAATQLQPGELRTLGGSELARLDPGVAVASASLWFERLTDVREKLDVRLRFGPEDADGVRRYTLFAPLGLAGHAPTSAHLEIRWLLPSGGPFDETVVYLEGLVPGHQILSGEGWLQMPNEVGDAEIGHVGAETWLVLRYGDGAGPQDLGGAAEEAEEEGFLQLEPVVRSPHQAPDIETPPSSAPSSVGLVPQREATASRPIEVMEAEEVEVLEPSGIYGPSGGGRDEVADALSHRPAPRPVHRPEPEPESEPEPAPITPWDLIDDGDDGAALARFEIEGLQPSDKQQVLGLLEGGEREVVLACRIAVAGGWSGVATQLRRMITHESPGARAAVAETLGALAGPSMVPVLRRLKDDESEEVARAAQRAITQLLARR